MSLYPTKTRLALLQAVADGQVTAEKSPPYDSYMDRGGKVTARCEQLYRAGWIVLGQYRTFTRLWELTAQGRQILAEAGAS